MMNKSQEKSDEIKCKSILDGVMAYTTHEEHDPLEQNIRNLIDTVIIGSHRHGVKHVLITSLLKKIEDPRQDIRKHKANMRGGYNGRSLDRAVVVPFMIGHRFDPNNSNEGWLTRALALDQPYVLGYNGSISPKHVKTAFLQILNFVQKNPDTSIYILRYIFRMLVIERDKKNIEIQQPHGVLTIAKIIECLTAHFTTDYHGVGSSRLPVIAVQAVYRQIVCEVYRYSGCTVKDLQPHTSSDQRSGALGDIEIAKGNDIFEAIEIKHNLNIDDKIIRSVIDKIRGTLVTRYYILTTFSNFELSDQSKDDMKRCLGDSNCQIIVNGVLDTIKYYLRMLNNPLDFIKHYAYLLQTDPNIDFVHKTRWNEIIGGHD